MAIQFTSTKDDFSFSVSGAMTKGLAPDGGLFVPEHFPKFKPERFTETDFVSVAIKLLKPFFDGDDLIDDLEDICEESFDFPVKITELGDNTTVLELFHGPTLAFKDFGAKFLSNCLSRHQATSQKPYKILVATSGDTGGAVASAFYQKPGVEVGILFPKDGISKEQRQQLTCWSQNISAFEVRGSFDDCQAMVKKAFQKHPELCSANSINIGRLLPQMIYYAYASLKYYRKIGKKLGKPANFVIPTGNLGNAIAAFWAKKMGLPIGRIALASNANSSIVEYYKTGSYQPRPSIQTLANAMDVGAPSNIERLFHLHTHSELLEFSLAKSVSDHEIASTIKEEYKSRNRIWCPHTATALSVRQSLEKDLAKEHWFIVSTAHPAKFKSVIEPMIKTEIETPHSLMALMDLASTSKPIEASLDELEKEFF